MSIVGVAHTKKAQQQGEKPCCFLCSIENGAQSDSTAALPSSWLHPLFFRQSCVLEGEDEGWDEDEVEDDTGDSADEGA